MKKTILCIAVFTLTIFAVNAQKISANALGLRLGDNNGFGGEISYQRAMGNTNRLELDLGSGNNSYKLSGTYQWVMGLENNFNWYAGFGGGIGSWKNKVDDTNNSSIFAAGVVGIEYDFDAPILISLDIRPEFGFNNTYSGLNSDIALGIRYQF